MCARPVPPVVLADDRFLVFDKPSGLLSVPGIGSEKADCLASRAAEAYPGARIVHRLDRDTSGVIILARDADGHRELSRQFQDREVEKIYVAVVAGLPDEDEGVVDLPMRKDMVNTPLQVIDHEHGRRAVTRWRVLDRDRSAGRARLELRPLTGRSHQLRLHLRELGHPILGDDLYAPPASSAAAPRLLLHALELRFAHPSTGEPVRASAPCPF